jgi:hypothetical protein
MSGRFHWATIEQQTQSMRPSTISLSRKNGTISGTTKNVALLKLDLDSLKDLRQVDIDGQKIEITKAEKQLVLSQQGDKWSVEKGVDSRGKNASRGGPFVTVFNHRVMFVYGTGGGQVAAADAFAAARQLAEAFYYRGNGSIEVIPDTAFNEAATADRNVILFGNADSNSAWATLLGDSPIRVGAGSVKVGQKEMKSDDLCAVFIRPRKGSEIALVAGVACSGHGGTIAIERLPIAASGVGFPDWMVISADAFTSGVKGVRAAGYFGNDWSLEKGETVVAD